jgi:hypothetical protein
MSFTLPSLPNLSDIQATGTQAWEGIKQGATAFATFAQSQYANLRANNETVRGLDTALPAAMWSDIGPTYRQVDRAVRPLLNQAVRTVRPLLTAAYITAGTYATTAWGSIQTNGTALIERIRAAFANNRAS